jgi:SAM-dependent methyltransferase
MYQAHAARSSAEVSVGADSFELIGLLELSLLEMEGLHPTDTLVDVGCGVGRLATNVIPKLVGGHYIGTDVSDLMLSRAAARVRAAVPAPPCEVSWAKQTGTTLPLADGSVDMFCAFSVFTHMEHEDVYNMLKDARRVARTGTRFVFSCLPLVLSEARERFVEQAALDFHQRWAGVRNVTTITSFIEAVATMAGWSPQRWYPGDEPLVPVSLGGVERRFAFGQSVCVLEPKL